MSTVKAPPKRIGRPKGASQKITTQAREEAKLMGCLPHEWLLKVTRGEPIVQRFVVSIYDKRGALVGEEVQVKEVYPDLAMRVDAAKAAAPYYAPRLATQVLTLRNKSAGSEFEGMSDEELDKMLHKYGKQLGKGT